VSSNGFLTLMFSVFWITPVGRSCPLDRKKIMEVYHVSVLQHW